MFPFQSILIDDLQTFVIPILSFAILYYCAHAIFFTIFNLAFGIKGRTNNSLIPDFFHAMLTLIMWLSSYLVVNGISKEDFPTLNIGSLNDFILYGTVLLAFILIDFMEYWIHFAFHRFPILWFFHKVHHKPKEMNWAKAVRLSIVESFGTALIMNLFVFFIFGEEKLLFLTILFTFKRFYGFFLHSNTDFALGKASLIFNTPRFHHWHHATYAQRPVNLSTIFPFWDKLFKTYYGEGDAMPEVYGIIQQNADINNNKAFN